MRYGRKKSLIGPRKASYQPRLFHPMIRERMRWEREAKKETGRKMIGWFERKRRKKREKSLPVKLGKTIIIMGKSILHKT